MIIVNDTHEPPQELVVPHVVVHVAVVIPVLVCIVEVSLAVHDTTVPPVFVSPVCVQEVIDSPVVQLPFCQSISDQLILVVHVTIVTPVLLSVHELTPVFVSAHVVAHVMFIPLLVQVITSPLVVSTQLLTTHELLSMPVLVLLSGGDILNEQLLILFELILIQLHDHHHVHCERLLSMPDEHSVLISVGRSPVPKDQLTPHTQGIIFVAIVGHIKLRCSLKPSSPASSSHTMINILATD